MSAETRRNEPRASVLRTGRAVALEVKNTTTVKMTHAQIVSPRPARRLCSALRQPLALPFPLPPPVSMASSAMLYPPRTLGSRQREASQTHHPISEFLRVPALPTRRAQKFWNQSGALDLLQLGRRLSIESEEMADTGDDKEPYYADFTKSKR